MEQYIKPSHTTVPSMYHWFWKCGRLFFYGQITLWDISRDILRGPRLSWPLNCPERSEGQFRGQKSRGPLKMSREMSHKLICPKPKIISQMFKNFGKLVSLCPIATRYPKKVLVPSKYLLKWPYKIIKCEPYARHKVILCHAFFSRIFLCGTLCYFMSRIRTLCLAHQIDAGDYEIGHESVRFVI